MRHPLLLVGLVLVPFAALAQAPTVPADLFYAAAHVRDAESVTVGEAPDRMRQLLPEGAEVLGTFSRTAGGGVVTDEVAPARPVHATTMAWVGGAPDDVARAYALDPPAGWRTHDAGGPPEGGFSSSAPLGGGVTVCPTQSGPVDEPVRIGFSPRPAGGTYMTLSEGGWYRVRCDGTTSEPPSPFGYVEDREVTLADLPVLSPPPRGRQQTRGGGGSNDYLRQGATLFWEGEAESALRHYGSQLESASWVRLASGGGERAAAGTWSRPADGAVLTATVTVVQVRPDQFALRLTLGSSGS